MNDCTSQHRLACLSTICQCQARYVRGVLINLALYLLRLASAVKVHNEGKQ